MKSITLTWTVHWSRATACEDQLYIFFRLWLSDCRCVHSTAINWSLLAPSQPLTCLSVMALSWFTGMMSLCEKNNSKQTLPEQMKCYKLHIILEQREVKAWGSFLLSAPSCKPLTFRTVNLWPATVVDSCQIPPPLWNRQWVVAQN